jgi:hypothetical protein
VGLIPPQGRNKTNKTQAKSRKPLLEGWNRKINIKFVNFAQKNLANFAVKPIKMSIIIKLLNPDGSVYHLNLKPEHIAHDIILWEIKTVWKKSPNSLTVLNFDSKESSNPKGFLKAKRITMSTGIGPDNIDIVMNELDALVNIDLETRKPRKLNLFKYYQNKVLCKLIFRG